MQIINSGFFSNLRYSIKNNRYAYFVVVLILIAVIGSLSSNYLSSFYKLSSDPALESDSTLDQEDKYLDTKVDTVLSRVSADVNLSSSVPIIGEVSVQKTLSNSELAEINNNSEVFKLSPIDPVHLSKESKFTGLNFDNKTIVKGYFSGTLEDFEIYYISILNKGLPPGYSFKIKKHTERPVDLLGDEYEFPEPFSSSNSQFKQVTYGLYLNNSLVVDSFGQSSFTVIYNRIEKSLTFNIYKFFPKTLSIVGGKSFSAGAYEFKPSLALDPDLVTVLIDSGEKLDSKDFTFYGDTKPIKIYAYDQETGYLIPQVAFSGKVSDIQGVLNSEIIYIPD